MREVAQQAIAHYLSEGVPKNDTAYYVMRQLIIENHLAPGLALSERSCKLLGLSRTPVKSALMRLSYDEFVESGGDGLLVARMEMRDVPELYEVREGLECKAAELFARRKTPEMTRLLVENHERHAQLARGDDWVRTSELDNNTHLIIAKGSLNKSWNPPSPCTSTSACACRWWASLSWGPPGPSSTTGPWWRRSKRGAGAGRPAVARTPAGRAGDF